MTNTNIKRLNRTEFILELPKILNSLRVELYYDNSADKVIYIDLNTNTEHNYDFSVIYDKICTASNIYVGDLEFQKSLIAVARRNVKCITLTDYDYLILDIITKLNKDKFTVKDIIGKLFIANKDLHKKQKEVVKSLKALGCVYHGHINNKQYPSGLYWSINLEPIQHKESNSTNSKLPNPNSNPNSSKALHSIDPNSTNSNLNREELEQLKRQLLEMTEKANSNESLAIKLNHQIIELKKENTKLLQANLDLANKLTKEATPVKEVATSGKIPLDDDF